MVASEVVPVRLYRTENHVYSCTGNVPVLLVLVNNKHSCRVVQKVKPGPEVEFFIEVHTRVCTYYSISVNVNVRISIWSGRICL
jgi:hypothetical protein